MAATNRNAMWIEETRKKVQTSQLINRLQDHGLGTVELSATQVRAIEVLLRKTIPDLSATTHDATDEMAAALAGINVRFGSGPSGD